MPFLVRQRFEEAEILNVTMGEAIFYKSDLGKAFYILQSGRLRVRKAFEDKSALTMGYLYPGDHFGEGALLTGQRHRATVRAVEDSEVLRVPRDEFFKVLKKEP